MNGETDSSGGPPRHPRDGDGDDAGAIGEAAERVRRAIASVVDASSNGSIGGASNNSNGDEELRAAARALVTDLRDRNEPPEKVLLHIKGILGRAGLRPTFQTDGEHSSDVQAAVYRNVITLSIEAYYDDEHSDNGRAEAGG